MNLIGWILAFVVAITIHEAAHAWMADRLGDPTARIMGRLSLNPLVHYDTVGTTLLIILIVLRTVTQDPRIIPIGWAKPVRFDPFNLENPKRDSALISLAGPASNLLLAVGLSILLRASYVLFPSPFLSLLITPIVFLNIILALFNLVPVHPLDGGKIFIGLLPDDQAREADVFLRRYGIIILFLLIFPTFGGTSPIFAVLGPIISLFSYLLLPGGIPTI